MILNTRIFGEQRVFFFSNLYAREIITQTERRQIFYNIKKTLSV